MTQDKSIVDATPTKELFISMLIRDVTLRDAIGDLLDNCIDGALRLRPGGNYHGLKVDIELNTTKGYFRISDNCGGIPVKTAREQAFRFGRSHKKTKNTKHSVGVFGIGMKRALFKLGKHFHVESIAKDSNFDMNVNVEEWKLLDDGKIENWHFKFHSHDENLKKPHPLAKRGTKIEVTNLSDEVKESFKTSQDMDELIKELEREHLYSISKGLKITINDRVLNSTGLNLLGSKEIKSASWTKNSGKVKVRIITGISEAERYGPNGGWYVFGNNRLILGPDHTERTGWGVKKPIRIPEYHSQFYRFRGYVFLDADDPQDLPWNTSKTNMDLDSPIYRTVLQQMIVMMRTVIDFLNKLHDEKADFEKGTIKHKPLEEAVQKAKSYSLDQVTSTRKLTSKEVFVHPEPATRVVTARQIFIRFEISKGEQKMVKDYFESDSLSEIGREIFNYFLAREI